MSDQSAIEWTDATWNPVRGCTKISPGCKNCYAETFAERWRGVKGHPYEQGFDLRLVPDALTLPLKWRKPKRIFVNSMSDLFHEDVPVSYIRDVCRQMELADWHTFQVLTKRPERMVEMLSGFLSWARLPNVWWGTSVEDRKHGLPRVKALGESGIRNTFLSCEPLLEDLGELNLSGIRWVIVGGESGPVARPCAVEWIHRLVAQCAKAGVPAFVKQLGANPAVNNANLFDWPSTVGLTIRDDFGGFASANIHLKSRKGGDMSEWPEDIRIRQFPL